MTTSSPEERFARLLQLQQKNQLLQQELLQDPIVSEFMEKHPGLPQSVLQGSLPKILEYRNNRRHCEQCPGLDLCPLDLPGHYTHLEVVHLAGDTRLEDRRVRCRHQRVLEHQQQIRRNIMSYHDDREAVERGYDAQEIASREKERTPAVRRVLQYLQQVTHTQKLPKKGLYLQGGFGTGKTYLLGFLLHELAKLGHTGVIVYLPEFVEDMKLLMNDPNKLQAAMKLLKETDLLVLDDIGAENLNPWVRDHILGMILNDRMDKKPTFYTSNYALADLQTHLSFTHKDGDDHFKAERLINRIAPYVEVIRVTGANQRPMNSLNNKEE
ncbi:AFG1/ZapE family ATPase [Paenibacillus shenyangensis]|uniref:AFG1/ZapE family ATPase n=1 Tax=Paenibacillus sp. A9 TaxID=1284352 RepID=UPI000379FD59|nr:AFG1/ZapE family ATPase [Paenibacillus sp. A9]